LIFKFFSLPESRKKFAIILSHLNTPQMCRYTTLCFIKAQQRAVLWITPLLSGVTGWSASSSSRRTHWTFGAKTA